MRPRPSRASTRDHDRVAQPPPERLRRRRAKEYLETAIAYEARRTPGALEHARAETVQSFALASTDEARGRLGARSRCAAAVHTTMTEAYALVP